MAKGSGTDAEGLAAKLQDQGRLDVGAARSRRRADLLQPAAERPLQGEGRGRSGRGRRSMPSKQKYDEVRAAIPRLNRSRSMRSWKSPSRSRNVETMHGQQLLMARAVEAQQYQAPLQGLQQRAQRRERHLQCPDRQGHQGGRAQDCPSRSRAALDKAGAGRHHRPARTADGIQLDRASARGTKHRPPKPSPRSRSRTMLMNKKYRQPMKSAICANSGATPSSNTRMPATSRNDAWRGSHTAGAHARGAGRHRSRH